MYKNGLCTVIKLILKVIMKPLKIVKLKCNACMLQRLQGFAFLPTMYCIWFSPHSQYGRTFGVKYFTVHVCTVMLINLSHFQIPNSYIKICELEELNISIFPYFLLEGRRKDVFKQKKTTELYGWNITTVEVHN